MDKSTKIETMKYYLLTFNEDYSDEHNVPALACMTETEYKEWSEAPSGELNENFEADLAAYNRQNQIDTEFWAMLVTKGYTTTEERTGHVYGNTSMIPKDDLETLELEREYREAMRPTVQYPKKCRSKLRAYLGNGGDYFDDDYSSYYLNSELVDGNCVQVLEVDESFHTTFHQARLDRLSLTNVFDIYKD